MDGSLILFHTTQVKLWDLNTSQYFWTLVNLKFGHNLMFSITLENIKLYYNLFIKNMCFYYLLKCKEISYLKAIQEMMINIKTNAMEWKILFLEKFRKKNHQIWSLNDEEIQVTNFNFRLKKRKLAFLCSSFGPCMSGPRGRDSSSFAGAGEVRQGRVGSTRAEYKGEARDSCSRTRRRHPFFF